MPALIDVSLSAYRNEFVALTGPSGCGKSTLLRIIAGLIKPTSGSVKFLGNPVVGPRTEITMVFQNFVLLPWKTSLDNVAFGLSFRKDLSEEKKERHRQGRPGACGVGRVRERLSRLSSRVA